MDFFKYFTPVSYWLLTVLWLFIFVFYVKRIIRRTLNSQLFLTLLTILAIDSFRTLFESVYFGFWYTSLVGFIPKSIHDFLVRPENVFLPKFFNLIAATLVIFIVIKRWIPEETEERERERKRTEELEKEMDERKIIQDELIKSENQLIEAQGLARIGHYVLDVNTGTWTNSAVLDVIFGIDGSYGKDVEGWANLIHPEDRRMMTSYLQKEILTEHREFNRQYRIINARTGETLWVHGIGHLKFDEGGEILEMFGTIQDISEHKKLVNDLEAALKNIKDLSGLLPICSRCKAIRDDRGYWNQLESYLDRHSNLSFSHSLCPKCTRELYGNEKWYKKMNNEEDT